MKRRSRRRQRGNRRGPRMELGAHPQRRLCGSLKGTSVTLSKVISRSSQGHLKVILRSSQRSSKVFLESILESTLESILEPHPDQYPTKEKDSKPTTQKLRKTKTTRGRLPDKSSSHKLPSQEEKSREHLRPYSPSRIQYLRRHFKSCHQINPNQSKPNQNTSDHIKTEQSRAEHAKNPAQDALGIDRSIPIARAAIVGVLS